MRNHKYHYLYKIVNNITGEYYYGVHSTDNLNDSYFGSGSSLYENIKKYGRSNFTKNVLEFFPNRKELMIAERKIVNENTLKDEKCLNIILGGGELKGSLGYKCVVDENGNYLMVDKSNNEFTNFFTGRICINKDGNMKYVRDYELDEYLANGWERGTIYCSPGKDKIWMNKNGVNKFVSNDEKQTYIDNGWELGMHDHKNRIWVNKNGSSIQIKECDLESYLGEGWSKGFNRKTINGRIIVTKNGKRKYVEEYELQKYIDDGWSKRLWEDMVWMHKDCKNIRVSSDNVQNYIEEGWVKGRYYKTPPKSKKVYLYDLNGNLLKEFERTSDANKEGYNNIHKYVDTGKIYMEKFYVSRNPKLSF